jgi:hypothetical protein
MSEEISNIQPEVIKPNPEFKDAFESEKEYNVEK